MLKIKLARYGKRNQPHFRIVVNEDRDKRDGSYVALLGHYAPAENPKILEIDVKTFKEWVGKGAQPTETVAALFKRYQSKDPFPAKPKRPSRKALAKAEAAKQPQEETKPPEVEQPAEVPTEGKPVEASAEEQPAEEKVAKEQSAEETPATEEK
jgi:small subunit ribosomal protein S16